MYLNLLQFFRIYCSTSLPVAWRGVHTFQLSILPWLFWIMDWSQWSTASVTEVTGLHSTRFLPVCPHTKAVVYKESKDEVLFWCFWIRTSLYFSSISRPTDVTCDRFYFLFFIDFIFYSYLYSTCFERQAPIIRSPLTVHTTSSFLCLCLPAALSCKKLSAPDGHLTFWHRSFTFKF
jgi:hypothetical protein